MREDIYLKEIRKLAKQYKKWIFSSEEQLKNIESIALEEQVTELISSEAKCESEKLNFEEIMSMS